MNAAKATLTPKDCQGPLPDEAPD
ncbi:hypothetical protein SCAR479_02425 [Seiridium cardinale]|uniref:Uncharacterized protein n=1 Tax=Seiridium cardinale TaxID=138064 RepID=A0ABR2X6E9_9PEZI